MNGCRMNCCLFRIPRMIRGEISSDTITIPEIGKNSKRIVVRETGYLRFLEMIPRGYSRGKGSSAMPAAGLFPAGGHSRPFEIPSYTCGI